MLGYSINVYANVKADSSVLIVGMLCVMRAVSV